MPHSLTVPLRKGPSVVYLKFLVCLSMSMRLALAESAGSGNAGAAAALPPGKVIVAPLPSAQPGNFNPGTLKSFDEGFFDAKKADTAPPPPGTSEKGREYAPDPDYNSQQREQWIQKCAPYKDKDAKLFRECYQKEREKMRLELREKFDAVERRQGMGKTPTEELLQPNKGSGGFD